MAMAYAVDLGRERFETVWTDVSDATLTPYRKSKALAEQAAWDFLRHVDGRTTLTTILPSAVFGPVLTAETLGSVLSCRAPAVTPPAR
jgi:nucleoside-diphosphate-sugar epimerase